MPFSGGLLLSIGGSEPSNTAGVSLGQSVGLMSEFGLGVVTDGRALTASVRGPFPDHHKGWPL